LKPLGLRRSLAIFFAAAIAGAMLVSGAAVLGVLLLEEHAERAEALERGTTLDDDDFVLVQRAAAAMAIVAPLAAGGAALLGLRLARRALAPMTEASRRAANARASELDLTLPLSGKGDEWDDLARTLNALLADARDSMLRVRRFTADAAHELRTPLTTILGEAELALRRERSASELRAALTTVKSEGEQLVQLLEGLLALARADAGTLLSGKTASRLEDIVKSSIGRVRERARQGEAARVRIDCVGDGGSVKGNPLLLSRAVENLLDNAVRYARDQVTVSISADAAMARVRVIDDGPGVAAEVVPELFERFVRADTSRARGGFGLGLSLTRAIAQAHDGTVEFLPSPHGAVFELALPILPS
jgi:signal transduction histidine kinase